MAEERNNNVEEEIEDTEENNSEVESTNNQNNQETNKCAKTFTQDQVNRMMAREKSQGRNSVYKELGINSNDANTVAAVKEFLAGRKTDAEKAADDLRDANNKVSEAEQRAIVAEAKAEAMMLGVKSQFVDDIVTLALNKLTDDGDLKTVIGELKTKYSTMFGSDEEDKQQVGKKGTGSSVNSSKSKEKENEEKSLGARLAAQRRQPQNKKSYWGNKT